MNDSAVARYIASNLGRISPRELAETTGFSEAQVVEMADEYYDSIILTARQRQAKLLMQLEDIAQEAIERGKNANHRDSSGNLNSAIAAIKAISKELDDSEKREDSSKDEALANKLTRIVENSFNRCLGELKVLYPAVEAHEIEAKFQRHLFEVAVEADAGNVNGV